MNTSFPKLPAMFHKWGQYFHAGTEWLETVQVLDDHISKNTWFPFSVYPHAVYFSLELFVKSLAAHENPNFDAKKEKVSHSATKIIEKYESTIPLFHKFKSDTALMELIKEFEKTLDTRFGETHVITEKMDTERIMDAAYEIRTEMCTRTKLR